MKKIISFLSAAALVLIGLSSCVDQIDKSKINPTFDPETNTVTTKFVINVANGTQTKSGPTTVQYNGANFRGMDSVYLLTYAVGGSKYFVTDAAAATAAGKKFDFPTLLASGDINNTETAGKSHRILEIGIPTGTDAVLFYGKALRNSGTDAEIGRVNYGIKGDIPSDYSFSLISRVNPTLKTRYDQTAALIAYVLSRIIQSTATYTVNTTTYPSWSGAASITTAWKDLGTHYDIRTDGDPTNDIAPYDRALTPLEENLGKTYSDLTTIASSEYRAGSGSAVIQMVQDLYRITYAASTVTPTSVYEELAKELAGQIVARIGHYFTIDASNAVSTIKTKDAIKTYLTGTAMIMDAATFDASYGQVVSDDLADFPVTTFQAPRGAAILAYDAGTTTFNYVTSGKSLLSSAVDADIARYRFPAELIYTCNSSIRTADVEKLEANYPNGWGDWVNNSKWDSDWSAVNSTVTSNTRAVAMSQNVNYGVAMLQTTVGIATSVTGLEDKKDTYFPGEGNTTIPIANVSFTIKGILVGGQPETVNWRMLPTTTTFDKVVYDSNFGGSTTGQALPVTAGTGSTPNYTIVFDNYNSSGTQNNKVRIAVEFVNNGDGFWGRDNYIRKGGTFYLVGELDMTGMSIAAGNWDTNYQVPPVDANGVSTKETRIFVQDFMTTANLWLSSTSLQGAYVSVPDLRSNQLSFGLSVDINWQPGLVFDNVVLGGNNS